ncbi:hypothetical protein [Bradyrhizobium sp. STM 3557]|uniref:hypothetical protein n=1 Tax=Bradyrhizobium sp. STM 3557 TaxID=578920 RepID=UPI00388CF5E7
MLIGGTATGWTQSPRSQPSLGLQEQGSPPSSPSGATEPQQSQPPPVRQDNPGLFQDMGKLFDKILPLRKSDEGGTATGAAPSEGTSGAAGDALKGTGETLSRLAKPSTMVTGRSVCPLAANRTPDCKMAADKLCQSKGYKEGKSLNSDAAESCSPKVLIPGRARKPDDCRTDTYVTSALCQ